MTDVQQAARKFRAAEKRTEAAREELAAAIRAADAAGVRQTDLVKATGYTREHVRRLTQPPKQD